MNAPSPDKSSRQYGDAFEFWWAAAGLAHACKPEAWEAWKASARRPDEPAARPSPRLKGDELYASHGYALATRVLQSGLYDKLDDRERAECDALVRGETPPSPLATTEPVDPESEAANPVWDLVVAKCRKAWPQTKGPICWNESPLELITQIINERDEAYETAAALCDGAGSDAGRIVGSKLAERIRELKGTSAVSHTEAPFPDGYKTIEELIAEYEKDPTKKALLDKARASLLSTPAPIQARSKSEYKRLDAMGANVVPPSSTASTVKREDVVYLITHQRASLLEAAERDGTKPHHAEILRDMAAWWQDLADAVKKLRDCSVQSATGRTVGPLTLDTDRQVFFYEQDHYYLSNFSAFKVNWQGRIFDTVEHAYHWSRFPEQSPERTIVFESASAHDAFRFAQEHKNSQRPEWDSIKVLVMGQILRSKVAQHEYVRRKLLATGDRVLIENSWRDSYWGWGENRDGQNMLGKLWMEVRDELSASTDDTGANRG